VRNLVPAALVLAFTVYCVVDVVRSDSSDVRGLPKTFWVILCLLFPLAGGIAWLLAGRPRTARAAGPRRVGRPGPSVLGPDDDVDFLRTIERPRPLPPAAPLDPEPSAPPAGGGAPEPRDAAGDDGSPGSTSRGEAGPGDSPHDEDGETGPGATTGTDDRRP
jgi:hypothetical protein